MTDKKVCAKLYFTEADFMPELRRLVDIHYGDMKFNERNELAYSLTDTDIVIGRLIVRMTSNGMTFSLSCRLEKDGPGDLVIFAALLRLYPQLPKQVQEILSDGRGRSHSRPLGDLGMDPMEEISKFFETFSGGDERIKALATKEFIFEPEPYPRLGAREFWYIPTSLFGELIQKWQEQLDAYNDLHRQS